MFIENMYMNKLYCTQRKWSKRTFFLTVDKVHGDHDLGIDRETPGNMGNSPQKRREQ